MDRLPNEILGKSFIRSSFLKTFRGLTTDVTFTINCAMQVNTCFRVLTLKAGFSGSSAYLPLQWRCSGKCQRQKTHKNVWTSSGVSSAWITVINLKSKMGVWLEPCYIGLGWFIMMGIFWSILQSSRQRHLDIYVQLTPDNSNPR